MTQDEGWWEEENDGGCPIEHNTEFKMVILVEEDKFKVSDEFIFEYCKSSEIFFFFNRST